MKILALETSTQLGGVAILVDDLVVAEEVSRSSKSHSENISPFIDICLQRAGLTLSEIDAFAIGQGPGSFTGIRIAANAGKTFSYAFNKPLVTVDSLTLLAEQARQENLPVLSIINAYKNMVYFGLFDVRGDIPKYIKGPEAIPVRYLMDHVDSGVIVVGDGWDAYQQYFPPELKNKMQRCSEYVDFPEAKTLAYLAKKQMTLGQTLDWKSFRPLYIRASEAEETRRGILLTPLK